jgi:Tfp pilus assembly protein PilZ
VPVDKILVSVYDREMGQAYGEVSNVSNTGACISADRHFEPDTTVLLRISFHHQPDAFVTQAEIVWSRNEPKDDYPHAHGVRFRFSEEGQPALLKEILESTDFTLACRSDKEEKKEAGSLDDLVNDLTDDLDKLGQNCHKVIGKRD